jgi:hypothetical protein
MHRFVRTAATLGAAAALAGCALYEPLERVAPRRRDDVAAKVGKSIVWAGGAVAITTAAVACIPVLMCCSAAQSAAHDAAPDAALRGGAAPMDARIPVFEPR